MKRNLVARYIIYYWPKCGHRIRFVCVNQDRVWRNLKARLEGPPADKPSSSGAVDPAALNKLMKLLDSRVPSDFGGYAVLFHVEPKLLDPKGDL